METERPLFNFHLKVLHFSLDTAHLISLVSQFPFKLE